MQSADVRDGVDGAVARVGAVPSATDAEAAQLSLCDAPFPVRSICCVVLSCLQAWTLGACVSAPLDDPPPSPRVGVAYWKVHDLLYAVRDIVLFPDFKDADSATIDALENAAGLAADIALGLENRSGMETRFRGPGSYVPRDPARALNAGRAVLDELRHMPEAERRLPARFATQWTELGFLIESLRDVKDATALECLALTMELVAPATPPGRTGGEGP